MVETIQKKEVSLGDGPSEYTPQIEYNHSTFENIDALGMKSVYSTISLKVIKGSYQAPAIEFRGSENRVLDFKNNFDLAKANSFIDAAKSAWVHNRERAFSDSLARHLQQTWSELDGENLTGLVLDLSSKDNIFINPNS